MYVSSVHGGNIRRVDLQFVNIQAGNVPFCVFKAALKRRPRNLFPGSSNQLHSPVGHPKPMLKGAWFCCYIFVSLFGVKILNIILCMSRCGVYAYVRRWVICVRPRGV